MTASLIVSEILGENMSREDFIIAQKFENEIYNVFQFLATDYGMIFKKHDDWDTRQIIYAEKVEIRAMFIHRNRTVTVALERLIGVANKVEEDILNVVTISNYFGAKVKHREFKFLKSEEQFMSRLQYFAELMQQYCGDILQGDLSIWQDIVEKKITIAEKQDKVLLLFLNIFISPVARAYRFLFRRGR